MPWLPLALGDLAVMTYTSAHVRMPESTVVNLKNCSWRITGEVVVDYEGTHDIHAQILGRAITGFPAF